MTKLITRSAWAGIAISEGVEASFGQVELMAIEAGIVGSIMLARHIR